MVCSKIGMMESSFIVIVGRGSLYCGHSDGCRLNFGAFELNSNDWYCAL